MTDDQVKQSYEVKEVFRPVGFSATQGCAVFTLNGRDKAVVIEPQELEGAIMILRMAYTQSLMIAGKI
jgi:hypothetical protein